MAEYVVQLICQHQNDTLDYAKYDAQIEKLRSILLTIAGSKVVGLAFNHYVGGILFNGRQFSTTGLRQEHGDRSQCHQNTAQLYISGRYREASIVTGYALFDDGIWRRHSWLLNLDSIVESTVPRTIYYGCELSDAEAILFCWYNLS
jgi:hypothetical protein